MRAASQANRQGRLSTSRKPSRRPAGLFSRTPTRIPWGFSLLSEHQAHCLSAIGRNTTSTLLKSPQLSPAYIPTPHAVESTLKLQRHSGQRSFQRPSAPYRTSRSSAAPVRARSRRTSADDIGSASARPCGKRGSCRTATHSSHDCATHVLESAVPVAAPVAGAELAPGVEQALPAGTLPSHGASCRGARSCPRDGSMSLAAPAVKAASLDAARPRDAPTSQAASASTPPSSPEQEVAWAMPANSACTMKFGVEVALASTQPGRTACRAASAPGSSLRDCHTSRSAQKSCTKGTGGDTKEGSDARSSRLMARKAVHAPCQLASDAARRSCIAAKHHKATEHTNGDGSGKNTGAREQHRRLADEAFGSGGAATACVKKSCAAVRKQG
eukprot:366119-Chlamydomonas_euryale.AAC.31